MTTEQTEAQDDGLPRLRTTAAQRAEIKARVIDPATHSLVDDIECLARELDAERNAHTAVWNGLDALTIAHESLRAQLEAARGERELIEAERDRAQMDQQCLSGWLANIVIDKLGGTDDNDGWVKRSARYWREQSTEIATLRADLAQKLAGSAELIHRLQEHQDALSEMRGRIAELEEAVVDIAHGMHKEPQYMLMRGLNLIDGNRIKYKLRNGKVIDAALSPPSAGAV